LFQARGRPNFSFGFGFGAKIGKNLSIGLVSVSLVRAAGGFSSTATEKTGSSLRLFQAIDCTGTDKSNTKKQNTTCSLNRKEKQKNLLYLTKQTTPWFSIPFVTSSNLPCVNCCHFAGLHYVVL